MHAYIVCNSNEILAYTRVYLKFISLKLEKVAFIDPGNFS